MDVFNCQINIKEHSIKISKGIHQCTIKPRGVGWYNVPTGSFSIQRKAAAFCLNGKFMLPKYRFPVQAKYSPFTL